MTPARSLHRMFGWVGAAGALFKIRISLMVTFSAAAGYLSRADAVTWDLLYTLVGVLLLSFGAVTLNHVQDAPIDIKMSRTEHRPIPEGRLSSGTAIFIGILLLLLGCASLTSIVGKEVALLGLGAGAVVWYNGIYYYLKRHSPFAAVPGAVIGALPPLMGWVGAGGSLTHPFALILASFFFIWQIPHFWLLQLTHTEDYRSAELPVLADTFRPEQLRRITAVWIWAVAAGGILLSVVSGAKLPFVVRIILVTASLWLVVTTFKLLNPPVKHPPLYAREFAEVNGYGLAVMVCLSLAGIL